MAEFFDIDGEIPVSLGLKFSDVPAAFKPFDPASVTSSVAWDTDPPRLFDPSSARRNGTPMSEATFWPFVAKVRGRGTLERAIAIAAEAHAGQVDKAGAPYILHPLRIMLAVSSSDERIVAVLHDVCEDCPHWPLKRLREEGFAPRILDAIDSVSRREDETYEDFITRAGSNPIGRAVKIADLRDNMDLSRLANPSQRDLQRSEKYRNAIAILEQSGRQWLSGLSRYRVA